jgi:hypothetical protein
MHVAASAVAIGPRPARCDTTERAANLVAVAGVESRRTAVIGEAVDRAGAIGRQIVIVRQCCAAFTFPLR